VPNRTVGTDMVVGNRLTHSDVVAFFDAQVQGGEEETAWTVGHSGQALRFQAYENVFARLHGATRHHAVAPPAVDQVALAAGLTMVVALFAQGALLAPFERRLAVLEHRFDEYAGLHPRMAVFPARDWFKAVEQHLDDIRAAYRAAFHGATPAIVVRPNEGDFERPVSVTLDARDTDRETVAKSRLEGGRRAFYQQLMDSLPTDVFDAVDFEFVFHR